MNTVQEIYPLFLKSAGISTDSRDIQTNQIYAALKGANFDGNTMAEDALKKGATYAIIDNPAYKKNDNYFLVDDVLAFLQQLGLFHRKQIPLKALIAVTGSNGKTTTKELINAVLATTYKTHYTKGNLNNHFGIPKTLLAMPLDTEIAVIEMGANHQKEIAAYCSYVEPDYGVITNIGSAHLEGFGGIEGVKKGKGELFDYLKLHNGTVFYNQDSERIQSIINEKKIEHTITYGKTKADYQAKIITETPLLSIAFEDMTIQSHLFGGYNFDNILCAIAIGKHFKVSNASIKSAIEQYVPNNKRSELITIDTNTIICDYYNANPTSTKHALESFAKSDTENKIVILGDMFELGDYALEEHQQIVDLAEKLDFDTIVIVGSIYAQTQSSKNVIKLPDAQAAKTWIKERNPQHTQILLKGSNGMKMEKVIS
ncbi:MAG: UDP-N-acetylmuramoyl-tripeptide--D-alanyl-D-alanine ligase [Bacteroidetes bacterium]|nr:UDP-N-acetylmuramoyl-tripeptide--D-alanyl-D-alanine ligase [Bacteroidota bacterium]